MSSSEIQDGFLGPKTLEALVRIPSVTSKFIQDNVSSRSMLELLAEEATELSKAALKMIRVDESCDDIYPVDPEKYTHDICRDNLIEEITDVYTCIRLLGLQPDEQMSDDKLGDMAMRIIKYGNIGGTDEK